MKVFLLSCVAAVVVMVGSHFILRDAVPLSSQEAYTVGSNVRVGDADSVTTKID